MCYDTLTAYLSVNEAFCYMSTIYIISAVYLTVLFLRHFGKKNLDSDFHVA